MDEKKIKILETTCAVKTAEDVAAALFYERFFVHDPSLRPLFTSADMDEQGRKLMAALAFTVGALRKPDTLLPVLENLGIKHVPYGVRREHYAMVGAALIETFSLYFGERFIGEVRAARTEVYSLVSGVMMSAAYGKLEVAHA